MNDKAESSKPLSLFLSYSRDDEAKARRLALALQHLGYTVWWDALIEGGATYARKIAAALESADVVIVLWSKNSVESDWVRDEAAQGRDRHRLVPLSLDGSQPPLGFRQYQVINLSGWRGRRGAKEIVALERAIAATASGEAAPEICPRQICRVGHSFSAERPRSPLQPAVFGLPRNGGPFQEPRRRD